jgi:putative transposase
MPRNSRIIIPDGIYHVTARGNRRQTIFFEDDDRRHYLNVFRRIQQECSLRCLTYILMSNHVHFVLRDPECELSGFMHDLHCWYAQKINRKYKKVGHLFQDRFYSDLCTSDEQLIAWIRYAHQNATRAGIVQDPRLYPWSSMRLYLQAEESSIIDRGFVLQKFGQDPATAQYDFLKTMMTGLDDPKTHIDDIVRDYQCGLINSKEQCLCLLLPHCMQLLSISKHRKGRGGLTHKESAERARIINCLHRTQLFSYGDLSDFFGLSTSGVRKILIK